MKLSDFIKQLQEIERDTDPGVSDSLRFYINVPYDIVVLNIDAIDAKLVIGCGRILGALIQCSLDDPDYELRRKDDRASRTNL